MKTIAISIPKPCHEDWNKMTPDAKGAFCGSCQKSVYDFSKKTDDEIIEVFEKEGEAKVCGRFTAGQLSRPVVKFGTPSLTSRLAMFAYALLLVFGGALFTGEAFGQEMKGEVQVKTLGKVAITRVESVAENNTDSIPEKLPVSFSKCGTRITGEEVPMTFGQAMVVEEPIIRMGDTILTTTDTAEIPEEIIEEEVPVDTILPIFVPDEMMLVAGGVSYVQIDPVVQEVVFPTIDSSEAVEEIIAPEDTTEERIAVITENIISPPSGLTITVSPNPSSGIVTLSYNLEAAMPVRIDLFDNSGKFIRTLRLTDKQYPGKYNVSYDISDLKNGVYTAILITANRKASAKIVLTK